MESSFDRLESIQGKCMKAEIIRYKSYDLCVYIGNQPFGLRWRDLDDIILEDSLETVKNRIRNHRYYRYGETSLDFTKLYDLLVRCGKMSPEERAIELENDNKLYEQLEQNKNV